MNPAFIRLLELGAIEAFRHIRERRASAPPPAGAPAPELTDTNFQEVVAEIARGIELSERLTERLEALSSELGQQRATLRRLTWVIVGQSVVLLGLVVLLLARAGP